MNSGQRGFLVFAVGTAAAFWIVDAWLDYRYFYAGASFGDLLVWDVPVHELYIRGLVAVLFLLFGLAVSVANRRRSAAEEELRSVNEQQLRSANEQLRAANEQLHAANEQLRAGEEQLTAANQQLIAGEQQLRAANERLVSSERALREEREREKLLNARLARAERMESLGILAGGVAHDLNNILGSIVTLPDIMLDDLKDIPPEIDVSQLVEDITTVRDTGMTAARVIHDLLTLSRRGHYETAPLILDNVIQAYLGSPLFKQIKDNHPGLNVEIEPAADLLPIAGSAAHLTQVLMNLVANAAEAMPHGGAILIVTENVYVKKHAIRYEVIEEGEYVTLSVSDTGPGISEEDLGRIFEPFYTRKVMGRKRGTGLGLSVVYGVTKDHNGYIDVVSSKGHGAKFTLYFPVTRDAVPVVQQDDGMPLGSETILVVDDVEQQRRIAERLLAGLGYRVTTAASGEDAVALMRRTGERGEPSPFDLVILDMIMADGIDGLDTYKGILEFYPGHKCIIVSGFSESERVLRAEALGAGRFLAKPYTMDRLARTVRAELDRAAD